jgi:hypothetical protein
MIPTLWSSLGPGVWVCFFPFTTPPPVTPGDKIVQGILQLVILEDQVALPPVFYVYRQGVLAGSAATLTDAQTLAFTPGLATSQPLT